MFPYMYFISFQYTVTNMDEANIIFIPFYIGMTCWMNPNQRRLVANFWNTFEKFDLPEDVTIAMVTGIQHKVSCTDDQIGK